MRAIIAICPLFRIVFLSSSLSETVETQQIGKVLLIAINRPEKRNAVDPNTAEQLVEAFTKFDKDPDSSVAVLYGKGEFIIDTRITEHV